MSNESWNFETRQIHAGQTAGPGHRRPRAADLPDDVVRLPRRQQSPPTGSRSRSSARSTRASATPRRRSSRTASPSLEGGVGALLVASGQAAETLAILNIAEAGDHIVASPSLYGGTYNLLHYTLPKLGIETTFVTDPHDAQAWKDAVQPEHQAVLRGDDPEPEGRHPRHRARRRRRARVRRAADRRQHRRDAVPDQPAEVGRRHRRALGDQVPGRSRLGDRRRDRRRRLVRLRAVPGAVPQLQHPRPVATTASCSRGTSASAALFGVNLVVHPQGPRAAAARPRLGDLAVQRVPHRAGHRDAVAADRAARRERREGRRLARGARRRRHACTTPAWSRARGTPRS